MYKRRTFIRAIIVGTLFALISNQLFVAIEGQRYNFIFILADDLGWVDLGCYGSKFYETPNIDKLADTGMKFTNGYALAPVCSPTRASILTGKYPARIDLTNWLHGDIKKKLVGAPYIHQLLLEELTIAEAMKKTGYLTFFAGKWHLGSEKYWPEHQGFLINKGGWDAGGPFGGNKYFSPYGNPRLEDGPPGEHLPDRLATESIKFIQENQNKSFFVYLSFYSVHTPLMARKDLLHKYTNKQQALSLYTNWSKEGGNWERQTQNHPVYASMVEAMDLAVGKVLDALDDMHLTEKTVVIFMSDNGGLSTSEGHPTSNFPLRAGKGWLYEGGVRVPYIIKWPGFTKPGSSCDVPVISTDFYPTILEISGLPLLPSQHKDGVSLVPLLKGEKDLSRKTIYWHYPHYSPQGGTPTAAIREDNFKLIDFFEDGHFELYDLKKDVQEANDLSQKNPQKAAKLRKKLQAWQKRLDAKMPSQNFNHRKLY